MFFKFWGKRRPNGASSIAFPRPTLITTVSVTMLSAVFLPQSLTISPTS